MEHLRAPTRHCGEQARAKVARRIDGVSRIKAETLTDQYYRRSDQYRGQIRRRGQVKPVGERKYQQYQQRRSQHLIDESPRKRAQEWLRICGPNAGGAVRACELPYAAIKTSQRFAINRRTHP